MMRLKILAALVWVALTGNLCMAQVQHNISLGKCIAATKTENGADLTTDHGKAKITVYSQNVIRVRVVEDDFKKNFSYAVTTGPWNNRFSFKEEGEGYTLETDSVKLVIGKNPVRFSFYTKDGKEINSDDPAFGTSWIGTEVTTYKKLHPDERFIGLGEQPGNLDRRNESWEHWNVDNPQYDSNSKTIYSDIPFFIGLHSGLCYGIFMDNSSKSNFNFGAGNNRFSSFSAAYGEMDYYFFYSKNVPGIIESYTQLTGRIPMPPLWSLGYQQCRWTYFPDDEVMNVATHFRERKIPVDMMYLDIHFMDHYKLFTWDKNRFPNPTGMVNNLKQLGYHLALIIDPGVKVEKGYPVYEDGVKEDIFIKYPDGTRYTGEVWPGWCNFPDFTMPKARQWWGKWFKMHTDIGIDGFWNDMNEIAAWGKDVPQLMEMNWEGNLTSYKEAKNTYGLQMARSTYEGTSKLMDGRRPFVLTRSGYSGLQRYTAIWTGDNQANEDHMMLGIRMLNSFGLSGVSFAGYDVGGFGGNPTPELYTRWMTIGAFSPMYRGHASCNTNRTEPWSFGEEKEDIVRRYIGFRYQLMPYIYSAFDEARRTGMPVQRSLVINYPFDEKTFYGAYQQQYLFGPSILVAPVAGKQQIAKVYLPEGEWYDLYDGKHYDGKQEIFAECPLNRLPVYIKGSSIIPMKALAQTTAVTGDTLYLHIYAGKKASSFDLYEDDGTTFKYQQNQFSRRTIVYNPAQKNITLGKALGEFTSPYKTVRVVLHGFDAAQLKALKLNNKPVKVKNEVMRYFTSEFAHADSGPIDTQNTLAFDFANSRDAQTIKW
ncbi:MAG: glycoside hydrolase family 31 protein [Bacteroidota bacterium]|nr:glycoside hydrolase family 31 protein [Bacteroidota bacterium]MDP4206263.1 glycoside hydrolase family 31 protein [Bacteroidota bacterium]